MKRLLLSSMVFLVGLLVNLSYSQTTITLQPGSEDGKDESAAEFGMGISYGDRESLVAYTWTNEDRLGLKRAFLAFDLSSIPTNSLIESAYLSLYFDPTDQIESFDEHYGDNNMLIQRIISEWNEHTIVWDNQPSTTTNNQLELPPSISSTADYLDIDVTTLVQDMTDSLNDNYGFMLRMADEINPYKSVLFASSDHVNPNLRPKLVITYTTESTDCVTIQPPSNEGKDAYISFLAGSTNTGGHQSLVAHAWTNGGIPGKARFFLNFDLTAVPENAIVKSAALSLFYNPTDNTQSFDYHTGENDFYIQRVIELWDENSVTWYNQPNATNTNQVKVPPSSSPTQDYLDIDVTKIIKDMVGPSGINNGMMIRMVDEINYYRCVLFASSDHPNPNLHPKLVVCYEIDTTEMLASAAAGTDANSCFNAPHTLSGNASNGTINWTTSGDGSFTGETTATPTYSFGTSDIELGAVVLTMTVTGENNTAIDSMLLTVLSEAKADAGPDASSAADQPFKLSASAMNGSVMWETDGDGIFSDATATTPTYAFGPTDLENDGAFLIMLVTGNCNIDTDAMYLSVESKAQDSNFEVVLFPNPSSGRVTISLNHPDEFSAEIINYLGQTLIKYPSVSSGIVLDVSAYAAGTYLVRLVSNKFTFVNKLIVN